MRDEDYVRDVYVGSYHRLVGQLFAICGDLASAEEVVQEAFVRALTHHRSFRAADLSPDHVALISALRRLPDVQREAIVLHHIADLPVHEVADSLTPRRSTMPDLDQHEIATGAARSALPPDFGSLVSRARRRQRVTMAAWLSVAVILVGGGTAVGLAAGLPGGSGALPGPAHAGLEPTALSCASSPQPAMTCGSSLRGDFLGNGGTQTLRVQWWPGTPPGSGGAGPSPQGSVMLADDGGRRSTLTLNPGKVPESRMLIAAGVDLSGAGRLDALVLVGQSATEDFYGIVLWDGHRLRQVTLDGQPFVLAVGGSVQDGDGGHCASIGGQRRLVVTSYGDEHENGPWRWSSTTYRWDGARLVYVSAAHGTTTARGALRYGGNFSCAGLTLPPR